MIKLTTRTVQDRFGKVCGDGHAEYLPHLDGLRAVALAGVLLFHFEVQGITGGFVGVDCFLVLSGFLISRNIIRNIIKGTFTFREFYVRRFWRLYPASLVTAVAALFWSFLTFPPDLAVQTIKSSFASMIFASNFHFLSVANYFDDAAVFKPLLHTWSLSLEEQFYAFWPLLLYLTVRQGSKSLWLLSVAVLITCIFSFLLGIILHVQHKSFVFFMLPCRLYEFGLGALCAMTEDWWRARDRISLTRSRVCNLVSSISLLILCSSYVLMPQQSTPFHVLPVIFATSAIICTPDATLSVQVLSSRALRYLGGITYSAYLAHWVLFVFVRHICDGLRLPAPSAVSMTIATIAIGSGMRKYVEDPLRKVSKKRVICMVRIFLLALLLSGGGLLSAKRDLKIADSMVTRVHSTIDNQYRDLCVDMTRNIKRSQPASHNCMVGSQKDLHSGYIFAGDSYARHLIPVIHTVAKTRGVSFTFSFRVGCEFMSRRDPTYKELTGKCLDFNDIRWKLFRGEPVDNIDPFERNMTVIMQTFSKYPSQEARKTTSVLLYEDLRALGYKLVIGGQPPGMAKEELWRFSCLELRRAPFFRIIQKIGGGRIESCADTWMEPRARSYPDWRLSRLAFGTALRSIPYIDIYGGMCRTVNRKQLCKTPVNLTHGPGDTVDLGYERDGHHLTPVGSNALLPLYEKVLSSANVPRERTSQHRASAKLLKGRG